LYGFAAGIYGHCEPETVTTETKLEIGLVFKEIPFTAQGEWLSIELISRALSNGQYTYLGLLTKGTSWSGLVSAW
jgi:hypothetical protein